MKQHRSKAIASILILAAFFGLWATAPVIADKFGVMARVGGVGAYVDLVNLNLPAGSSITGSTGTIVDTLSSVDTWARTGGNDTEARRLMGVVAGTGDLRADGTTPLTADWNVGNFALTAKSFTGIRTDAPQTVKLYESTSDGNDSITITVPAKATGLAADATVTFSQSLAFTGTMTDGKYCTYASSGTQVSCNSTPLVSGGALGTPGSGTLTNCGSLPISGIASLGSGVGTWMATPSSANLAAALTDETGSGVAVFGTNPAILQASSLGEGVGGGSRIPGTTLTASRAYYMGASALALAKADSANTMPAICVSDTTSSCMYSGAMRLGAAVAGCTRGKPVYVSTASAGLMTCTQPSSAGQQVQRVGVMIADDNETMLIMPSLDVMEVK